ncbi:phospholipid carrier-dependent glycosyltransferase [Paenibacillus rigui]|uniref:Polyprenol-phosphate-mannose--protein mannosyltransferase n=1 Tax=Paenibacillus rigui TaxID=554312 RepID=A0A229UVJ9_9BACL|nr:phospholipid carrier-dependent glycosyltransferase [Paenibacillus rigui]OXM87462.1 dolichyl-phosphate-mannose--protein mannosyltransferase [Paenibacillus rigui]
MATLIYSLLFTSLFFFVHRWMQRGELISDSLVQRGRILPVLLALGALLRWVIAGTVYGYDIDVHTFQAWAGHAAAAGPTGFYSQDLFVDYPPGYIYVLFILGKLRTLLSIPFDSTLFLILLKSPAIIADLLTAYLLYRWAARQVTVSAAAGVSVLYLFNPAIVVNAAAWGQVDSFFMLWVLLWLEALRRGAVSKAAILYAAALLIKPQALLLAPLLLLYLLRRQSWRSGLQCLGWGAGTFAVLALPFTLHQGPFWIVKLYFGTLASYPYASLNAFNLMSLLGGNFVSLTDRVLFFTYQTWSIALMAVVLGGCVVLYFKSRRDESQLVLIAGLLMAGAFLVLTKMHERYLFYALPLVLVSFIQLRDRRLLYLFIGLSLTHFVNVNQVLLDSMRQSYHMASQDPLLLVSSAVNTLFYAYFAWVSWCVVVKGERRELTLTRAGNAAKPQVKARGSSGVARAQVSAAKESGALPARPPELMQEQPLPWKRKDLVLLGILVICYSVLAFCNLGSLQAPETGWQATRAGESLVFDLGAAKEVERINSFSGIGDGSFTYELSEDKQMWSPPVTVKSDAFKVFMWQVVPINASGRYMKLTVVKPPFQLQEVAVYERGSEVPVPIQSVSRDTVNPATAGDLAWLYDESSKAAYRATFWNGAIFDEIYHARTAYEHLHQLEPYESTHPPLGKVLISWGISIFGMTPFGWRFMGTLAGTGMLPVIYVMGKRLLGRSESAFIACFLLACDGLHFVQSRIATIDVYAVFFIMLMFYYMHRFSSTSLFATSWKRAWVPLGLSGLCFGLGAASKWIAAYGGLGLACLWLLWLLTQYRLYRQAGEALEVKHKQDRQTQAEWRHIRDVFPYRAAVTVGWCVLYFIAVPMIVYILAYIPFMRVPGPGHGLADVLSYQKHMLSYHSLLTGTHPFSSSWWQWPLMNRPVWYYGAAELSPGTISSIVAIGNPLIWWVGFGAMLHLTYRAIRTGERTAVFLSVAYVSQYIPWMLVPRMTFLYHYFAMVPFLILALAYYCKQWMLEQPVKRRRLTVYLAAVAVCFILFYPVLSGLVVDRSYAEHVLKWFPRWQFF